MKDLRGRISDWVSSTLANRGVIEQLAETTTWTGRVKGLPSIGIVGESQGEANEKLRTALEGYAERQIGAGKSLPTWQPDSAEPSPDAIALVRIAILRRQLKERGAQWGAARQCLPPGVVERCLVEIDAVVSRHAMQMEGVEPSKN